MTTNRHINAYRQTEVQSRTPLELVTMLYDGALRFLASASDAVARNDLRERAQNVSRALDIICELQNTLNMEAGGEVARQLDALYTYMTSRLLDSTAKRDHAALAEVHKLLSTLREGWAEIAAQAKSEPVKVAV